MKENPSRAALLVIDMENGFVTPQGGHCIRGAAATVPACVRAVELTREKGIPVFFVKRIYRADGSDVELTRYEGWKAGGRACGPASLGPNSAQAPEGLQPQPGDYTIWKPRWSAFFHTELDLILRRLDIRTVFFTLSAAELLDQEGRVLACSSGTCANNGLLLADLTDRGIPFTY